MTAGNYPTAGWHVFRYLGVDYHAAKRHPVEALWQGGVISHIPPNRALCEFFEEVRHKFFPRTEQMLRECAEKLYALQPKRRKVSRGKSRSKASKRTKR